MRAPSGSLTRPTSPASGRGGSNARLPDWPERLDTVVEAARDRPFAWGTHDCVTFAAACIEAMTGIDPLAGQPPWRSRADAHRTVRAAMGRQAHGPALQAAISRIMAERDWPAIEPSLAGRGDLCLVKGDRRHFAAICLGGRVAAPGPGRLALVPLCHAIAAWRIG